MEIWRAKYLKPNMLVNFPEEGLNRRQRQSVEALRFFKLYTEITGKRLRTAEWTIGEKKVLNGTGFRVDALVLDKKKEAIEFLGCRFHGELTLIFSF